MCVAWGVCPEELENSPCSEANLTVQEAGTPHTPRCAILGLLLTRTQALVLVFLAGLWSSIQKWTFQRLNSTEPSPSPPWFSQPMEWRRIRVAGYPPPWASTTSSVPPQAHCGGGSTKSSGVVLCHTGPQKRLAAAPVRDICNTSQRADRRGGVTAKRVLGKSQVWEVLMPTLNVHLSFTSWFHSLPLQFGSRYS